MIQCSRKNNKNIEHAFLGAMVSLSLGSCEIIGATASIKNMSLFQTLIAKEEKSYISLRQEFANFLQTTLSAD